MARRPVPARRKLAYAVAATFAFFAIAEVASRVFVAASSSPRWHHLEKLVDTIGFPELNTILEPDPDRFWRLAANVEPRRLTGEVADSGPLSFRVSTDADGHRRTPAVPEAVRTVLFLGDSCTFGIGVDDEQAFAALLQGRLPGTRSINAGVPGYSSFQGLALLRSMPALPAPAATVVSFQFNDDAHWDDRSDLEHAAALRGIVPALTRHSRFVGLLATLLAAEPERRPEEPQLRRTRLSDAEYEAQVRAIVALCRERGSIPVLMIWPTRAQVTYGERIAKQEMMRRVALELDVALVDLVPIFCAAARAGRPLHIDVVHCNREGHEAVARALAPVLQEVMR
ncbi:MAG: hypothetical protein KDC98_07370 [Planctomycetes bacterium]|nr:hypothetical protein [Planctomycetota bacterium]